MLHMPLLDPDELSSVDLYVFTFKKTVSSATFWNHQITRMLIGINVYIWISMMDYVFRVKGFVSNHFTIHFVE